MADAKIIIAAHKEYWMPEDSMYLPLQVGAKGKKPIGYERDCNGKNISKRNGSFCELTGLYWAWKNLDAEYIGLVHYRRHFSVKNHIYRYMGDRHKEVLTGEQLDRILKNHDIVVPRKRNYVIETLYSHYAHTHYSYHLDITLEVIKEKYPDYVDDYNMVINKTSAHMFNMMIMRRDYLDAYCSWVFDILFEVEKRIVVGSDLSKFQKRFYGRISEIIFNVWLLHQVRTGTIKGKRIATVPYIYMEKIDWKRKVGAFLRAKFFNEKYEGSF